MNGELEQVSRCLDEALISFSGGQAEEGCHHLQQATAILDNVLAAFTANADDAVAVMRADEAAPAEEAVVSMPLAVAAAA